MDPDKRKKTIAKRLQSQIRHMSANLATARIDVLRALDEVNDRLEKAHRLAREAGEDPRSWSPIADVFEECSSMLDLIYSIKPPEELLSDPDALMSKNEQPEWISDEDPRPSLPV